VLNNKACLYLDKVFVILFINHKCFAPLGIPIPGPSALYALASHLTPRLGHLSDDMKTFVDDLLLPIRDKPPADSKVRIQHNHGNHLQAFQLLLRKLIIVALKSVLPSIVKYSSCRTAYQILHHGLIPIPLSDSRLYGVSRESVFSSSNGLFEQR